MSRRFYHELLRDERLQFFKSTMTWGELAEKYQQPAWCCHPEALMGSMGCWGLTVVEQPLNGLGEDYCRECDCHRGNQGRDETGA